MPAPKPTFLPAKRKHRTEMKAVNEAVLPENYPLPYWEHLIKDGRSQVVVLSGQVIGYCLCSKQGHIVSFAVLPAHQRKGYGRQLLQNTFAQVPGQVHTLHCRVSNEPAFKLYQSVGFEVSKTLERYYPDGENAYEMTRPGHA